MIIGTFGFLWLIAWRFLYFPPEQHPLFRRNRTRMIRNDKADTARIPLEGHRCSSWQLLKLPRTWDDRSEVFYRSRLVLPFTDSVSPFTWSPKESNLRKVFVFDSLSRPTS